MAKLAKLLQAAAGNAGGEALNVEEVFSTYLYDGSSSAQTITNGIDLDGEGGMVWIKERSTSGSDHGIHDTERGVKNPIFTNLTDAENSYYNTNNQGITAFNSDGFTVASGSNFNDNGDTAASWTFRKAPKFFDVVTWTGNSTAGRAISHNLGTTVGAIFIKETSDSAEKWRVYHRSHFNSSSFSVGSLNESSYFDGSSDIFNSQHPSSTEFYLGGSGYGVNESGETYVAYLFAHNDGDGEFGPDGDADIIKCGSFVQGTGSYDVDLGFEPQWVLIKSATSATNWMLFDNMRGLVAGGNDAILKANTSATEENTDPYLSPTSTGFTSHLDQITGNQTYIYIAIRRGPMAVPESADEVFDIATRDGTEPHFNSNFDAVDFALYQSNISGSGDWYAATRLTTNKILVTNSTASEIDGGTGFVMDFSGGWYGNSGANSSSYSWMWKRAPNFFDVVAYTGNGTQPHNISHNLGAVPEMIWVKRRNSGSSWVVYHKGLNGGTTPEQYNLNLDTTDAEYDQKNGWHDTAPTSTQFTVGSYNNGSGNTFIAYLFASLDGVSKVGSFSHTNNTTTSVDCGFSSGARFVMIKLTDGSDSWYIWDTERGINAGTEPFLRLNTNSAQITGADWIDPLSSGFQITGPNLLTGTYIFYAIA